MNKPRTFEHFPKEDLCPVCHTNIDEECVLLPIDGTEKDRICEAKPVHLYCAVADRLNDRFGVIYKQIL
jgi:hypothetical protein